MSPRLPRVRHAGRTVSKRPEGARPLFGPQAGPVHPYTVDPAKPYLGMAIGGVVLFAVSVLALVSWILFQAA